jgi:hypothetical protein
VPTPASFRATDMAYTSRPGITTDSKRRASQRQTPALGDMVAATGLDAMLPTFEEYLTLVRFEPPRQTGLFYRALL